jgi:hypothetical protein
MGGTVNPTPDGNNNTPSEGNNNNTPPPEDPNVPEELRGKSPAEIVSYYQQRETIMTGEMDRLRNQPPPANNTPPPANNSTEISDADYWNKPTETIKKIAVTREEFNATAAAVQRNMIEVAEMLAGRKHEDWNKWLPEVKKIMSTVEPFMQTDPVQWETAYHYAKGLKYDQGVQEAATTATRMASEPPTPTPSAPPVPTELTREQSYVAEHLGQTPDKYREGIKNLHEDNWPITFDTRKKAR